LDPPCAQACAAHLWVCACNEWIETGATPKVFGMWWSSLSDFSQNWKPGTGEIPVKMVARGFWVRELHLHYSNHAHNQQVLEVFHLSYLWNKKDLDSLTSHKRIPRTSHQVAVWMVILPPILSWEYLRTKSRWILMKVMTMTHLDVTRSGIWYKWINLLRDFVWICQYFYWFMRWNSIHWYV
jgi:hypothetical protein